MRSRYVEETRIHLGNLCETLEILVEALGDVSRAVILCICESQVLLISFIRIPWSSRIRGK